MALTPVLVLGPANWNRMVQLPTCRGVGLWHAQQQGQSLEAAGAFAAATAAFAVEYDGLFPARIAPQDIHLRAIGGTDI